MNAISFRAAALGLAILLLAGCATPDAGPDEPLLNTYWKLTRLADGAVKVVEGHREPYLVFHEQDTTVAGSTGCNDLVGRYSTTEDALVIQHVVTTLKACRQVLAQERVFLDALTRAIRWQITENVLVLSDRQGQAVARFRAVHLY